MTYKIVKNKYGIYANGRPDIPSTLDSGTQIEVAEASIGTEFHSLDGAGVKAYKWYKSAAGWEIIVADTGWITISTNPNYNMAIRREGNEVLLNVDNWSGTKVILPVGFGLSKYDGVSTQAEMEAQYGSEFSNSYIQFAVVSDLMNAPRKSPLANAEMQAYYNFPVGEKNDLNRAVGNIEINPLNEMYLQGTYQSSMTWNGNPPAQPTAHKPAKELWMKKGQTDPELNTSDSGISMVASFRTFSQYPTVLPTGV